MIQSGAGIIFYRIYIFICFLTLLSIFVLYVFSFSFSSVGSVTMYCFVPVFDE